MPAAEHNFGDLFEAVAIAIPDAPAVRFGEQTLSWRELDQRSNRLARFLLECGLGPDSKVAFYLRNSPAYIELFVACCKARLVHANINYRYVDQELWHVLDDCDAHAVVYDAEFRGQVDALRDRLPKVQTYLEAGSTAPPAFGCSFESACADGDPSPLGNERSGDDLYLMYTGGTTGYPKGVMWRHKDRIAVIGMTEAATAQEHGRRIALAGPGPIAMPACPMMHSTGLTTMIATLVAGGCVVLIPSHSFSAQLCLEQIERHRIERLAIVGDAFSVPIIDFLQRHPGRYDLSSVQLISSAGAMWSEPCKLALLEHFQQATLADSLGSSEGSRLAGSVMTRGQTNGTARFQIGPQVKVFTEDFREVTPGSGEAGMIAKAGPLPLGYYKDPERTARTFPTVDGVRYSMAGDWCTVETDGTITLLGRGNNCINTGGEKVYPEEVEEALKTMPQIADAAVAGVADPRWGQAVAALIRVSDGSAVSDDQVRAHLTPLLASYKHPRHILLVDEEFRHENGKINYRQVKGILARLALA